MRTDLLLTLKQLENIIEYTPIDSKDREDYKAICQIDRERLKQEVYKFILEGSKYCCDGVRIFGQHSIECTEVRANNEMSKNFNKGDKVRHEDEVIAGFFEDHREIQDRIKEASED